MQKFIQVFLIFSLLILGAYENGYSQQTKILSAEKHNEYGIIYSLPETAFEIEVTAIKETEIAGPFYKYAKKFAGDSKVISENNIIWTIESVSLKPFGVANPESRYLMQLKPGSTTFIGVGEDGMLLSINKEPENNIEEIKINVPTGDLPATGKEYLQYVDEDFISAQSSFKQAQLLGEELMEIRDAKISLTRGTAETMPTDGRQLEIMLSSLEKQEKALMQAFTGSVAKERISAVYTYIPKGEGKEILFRFSDFGGFVDSDDYSGDPVYINVIKTEEAKLPVDSKGDEKKMPKDAVVYCIPGTAELSLEFKGNNIFSDVYPMSQFGMKFGLNPSLFTDKKEPSYAIFDSATGALKELGILK